MERIARSIPKSAAEIAVRSEDGTLPGLITVPRAPVGTVVFAHDSGSNRLNPRDQALAKALNDYGVATLLIDLITGKEHELEYLTRGVHFDVELQGERLVDAIDWIGAQGDMGSLPIGILGASTGGAVALRAAAERPDRIAAVVCRGGRPELAGEALGRVAAPTLFIVGSEDRGVLHLNQESAEHLHCKHRVQVVEGATHLFEEPGKLDEVSRLAREWFLQHLGVSIH